MNFEKIYVDYPEIIVYDNVLLSDDCSQIADYMIDVKKDNLIQSGMPWEKGNNMFLQDIPEKFKNYLISYRDVLTLIVSEEYEKTLYPTHSDMVLWNEGDFMIPHVDNGSRGTEQDKSRPLISSANTQEVIANLIKERQEYYEKTSNIKRSR